MLKRFRLQYKYHATWSRFTLTGEPESKVGCHHACPIVGLIYGYWHRWTWASEDKNQGFESTSISEELSEYCISNGLGTLVAMSLTFHHRGARGKRCERNLT